MKSTSLFRIISFVAALLVISCGGSSSGGIVISGSLTQGEEAGHAVVVAKHSGGQPLGEVTICSLGKCSETDDEGQWGFEVGDSTEGEVLFTVIGHGIDSAFTLDVPEGSRDIQLELINDAGTVAPKSITIDGQEK